MSGGVVRGYCCSAVMLCVCVCTSDTDSCAGPGRHSDLTSDSLDPDLGGGSRLSLAGKCVCVSVSPTL